MVNNYCVYLHTIPKEISNYDYDKYYVGMTKNLKQRWSCNGEGYKACPSFYSAIQKYGWDNIKHDVLVDNLSKREAEDLEIYYIQKYESLISQKGYNIHLGGYLLARPGRQIAFYKREGKLWTVYKDINEVSSLYDISSDNIRKYINIGRLINGYKAVFVENGLILEKIKTPISKEVEQYDIYGNFIKVWNDGYEAGEYYSNKRNNRNIATMVNKVCLGYRTLAYGFQWKFKDDKKEVRDVSNEFVLCSNGQYITKYARYMQNHKKTEKKMAKPILYKYDLSGKYVNCYNTYKSAYNDSCIQGWTYGTFCNILRKNFLKSKIIKAKNYIWTKSLYEKISQEDIQNIEKIIIKNHRNKRKAKPCAKISKLSNIVEEIFESVPIAYEKTGIPTKQIYKCCKNSSKSTHGFLWKYLDDIKESQICDSFLMDKYIFYKN